MNKSLSGQSGLNYLLFIGKLAVESKRLDGVTIKNRVFYDAIRPFFNTATFIDLDAIRRINTLFSLLRDIFRHRHSTIVFASGGSTPSCRMAAIIQLLIPSNNRLIVLGLGGNMHHYILSKRFNYCVMRRCRAILAEGIMTRSLRASGLNNVYYVPNFKTIEFLPKKGVSDYKKIKFLFFARITPYKGCDLIFEAIEWLRDNGYSEKFEVHFYGMMLEDYRDVFFSKIEKNKDLAVYHGVLSATAKETHNELAQYDVMLFPTFWPDEGFPASLVDAFIAGLPVIASDWNQNSEIVKDGINGFIIPPHDSNALAEKMLFMIRNPSFISERVSSIQQDALNYDTKHVLNPSFLKKIGLCNI